MKLRLWLAAALAFALLGSGHVLAKTLMLSTELSGQNEAPPNGATATGHADATYDDVTRVLTWHVTYEGLTGPLVAAHIHGPAEPGSNAGIIFEFDPIEISPIDGSATLTEEQAADLLAGRYYVNLHTAAHPGGEIRGNLTVEE
jgi:hypothetical protein